MAKEKDNRTEKAILEAALKVFTEKGFAATRMDHIAKEARINRALLHYYFRNKDKMFDLILHRYCSGTQCCGNNTLTKLTSFDCNSSLGDAGPPPMINFFRSHQCNSICHSMGMKPFDIYKVSEVIWNPPHPDPMTIPFWRKDLYRPQDWDEEYQLSESKYYSKDVTVYERIPSGPSVAEGESHGVLGIQDFDTSHPDVHPFDF